MYINYICLQVPCHHAHYKRRKHIAVTQFRLQTDCKASHRKKQMFMQHCYINHLEKTLKKNMYLFYTWETVRMRESYSEDNKSVSLSRSTQEVTLVLLYCWYANYRVTSQVTLMLLWLTYFRKASKNFQSTSHYHHGGSFHTNMVKNKKRSPK